MGQVHKIVQHTTGILHQMLRQAQPLAWDLTQ